MHLTVLDRDQCLDLTPALESWHNRDNILSTDQLLALSGLFYSITRVEVELCPVRVSCAHAWSRTTGQSERRILMLPWQRGLSQSDRVSKVISVCVTAWLSWLPRNARISLAAPLLETQWRKRALAPRLNWKHYTNTDLQVLISTE